ncbi:MAG: SMI1/KNR4 family protein [Chloroflexi bacterium]|nr:SMI1/KNR4 family protein [Chloroflexota bacterium]
MCGRAGHARTAGRAGAAPRTRPARAVAAVSERFEDEHAELVLAICGGNGDYDCMRASGRSSEVVFWAHDDGASDERWPDLAAWIEPVWIGENG